MASATCFKNELVDATIEEKSNCQLEESFKEINEIVEEIEDEQIATVLYYCDELLEMNPRDLMTLYSKAKVLFRKGYYSHAITILREALELAPESETLPDLLRFAAFSVCLSDSSIRSIWLRFSLNDDWFLLRIWELTTIRRDLDVSMKNLVELHQHQGERKNKTASNNPLQKTIRISWKWLIGGVVVALGGAAASARLSNWK
uniref:peptidyl-prolyl cis-trans isomerase FKBP8-like n=1 Tax=Pristiophorus japonicus TaxID=55135 RepID=UPI00398F49D1